MHYRPIVCNEVMYDRPSLGLADEGEGYLLEVVKAWEMLSRHMHSVVLP